MPQSTQTSLGNEYLDGATTASFQILELVLWWWHKCFPNLWIITVVLPHLPHSKSLNYYCGGASPASFQMFALLPWWCHTCFIPNLWIITVVVPHLLHSKSLNYYHGGATLASFQIFELLPCWCHTCIIPNVWIITMVVPHLHHSRSLNYYCGGATPASFQIFFILSFTDHSAFVACRGTIRLLPQINLGCWEFTCWMCFPLTGYSLNPAVLMSIKPVAVDELCKRFEITNEAYYLIFPCTFRYFTFS